jgi:uncharacterized protein YbjT (DUF2867 family)
MTTGEEERMQVFVSGASGYVGGRIVPRLLEAGYRIRCLARNPRKLDARSWAHDPRVEVVSGDAADVEGLTRAMHGCGAAYYLIHSMIAAGKEYRKRDHTLALGFAKAAERASVGRIIYLGGLGEMGEGLSEHLASRREVEHALASGRVPVTVLRAAMIIGSGSASFEILRYLVERLPIMVTPKWVSTEAQPIAIRDALHYLVACLETPETIGRTIDIGGSDVMRYSEIMQIMAEVVGLRRRLIIPVPVLTPRLSSYWIHLVTPVSHRIARPLAMGLKNRVICQNDDARRLMPHEPLSVRGAIGLALGRTAQHEVETSWIDAGEVPVDPDWTEGTTFMDLRTASVGAPTERLYRTICQVGGEQGWYAADPLWKLRGGLDRLLGGPGLNRGRRHPERIAYGDALDFWRVTATEPGRRLTLRAEMKLPGDALLEFLIEPDATSSDRSFLTQVARFKPRGVLGLVYWYSILPFHDIVFRGMIRGIRRKAEADSR